MLSRRGFILSGLALGGGLAQLTEPILALLIMGAVLFVVSALIFGKKNLAQK